MKKKISMLFLFIVFSSTLILSSCNLRSESAPATVVEDETITEAITEALIEEVIEEEIIESLVHDAVTQVLSDLKNSDFDASLSRPGPALNPEYHTPADWPESSELFVLSFGDMEWSIIDIVKNSDDVYIVNVEITYISPIAAAEYIYSNPHGMLYTEQILEPLIFFVLEKMDKEEAISKTRAHISHYLIMAMESYPERVTEEHSFTVQYHDIDQDVWVTNIPDPFYYYSRYEIFDPSNILEDGDYTRYVTSLAGILLDNDVITPDENLYIINFVAGPQSPDEIMPIDEVNALILEQGWYDRNAQRFVDNYGSDATEICYVIFFEQDMYLEIFIEFYRDDDTDTAGHGNLYSSGLRNCAFVFDDFEGYPSDTYRIRLTLGDGSVIVDEKVTVG